MTEQITFFDDVKLSYDEPIDDKEVDFEKFRFFVVDAVKGSGYEEKVAELAIHDGIAHRAARPNMQKFPALIVELEETNDFVGFITFQKNHKEQEFCFLQSAIWDEWRCQKLYLHMVEIALAQNVERYPSVVTTSPKSDLETEELFTKAGFETYLKKSGFSFMVKGGIVDGHDIPTWDFARLKKLVQVTETNVWNSLKKEWLKEKKEWNAQIDEAGEKFNVVNPRWATREDCWMKDGGLSKVVNGKNHNGGASVLDPFACEVCLTLFMPENGKRVYNPFGGGVQYGFVSGTRGYEYVASEIRKNQCDANNAICSDIPATWVQADSSTYEPDGMFDQVFSCPPYYKVERYTDYDGNPPEGELNDMDTYEQFRDTLFKGFEKALEHLNENCFFIVMVGDSRDKDGNYYGIESETELWMKEHGLLLYNKIIFLESAFTKLAQVKHTMNNRKFPKQEQKIIVGYKGDPKKIKDLYRPIGRI